MPEESDGLTVCTRLRKVIPDPIHVTCIEDAVTRVHRITIDATELLALHVTRLLEENRPLPILDQNYVKMVMMEVSHGNGTRTNVDEELAKTRMTYMGTLKPVSRRFVDQIMMSQAKSVAASIQTNAWFHFPKRVFRYVRSLRREELLESGLPWKECKLRLMKMTKAICDTSSADTADVDGAWINEQRRFLGCDLFKCTSVKENGEKHLDVMLRATWLMNKELERSGERCGSCMPIRRQFRPAFCNVDTKALCSILHLPCPKGKGAFTDDAKREIWNDVLFMDKHTVRGVAKRTFACSMRTDGVSIRLLFDKPTKRGKRKRQDADEPLTTVPTRGIYVIDQLKHLSRTYQVVGADPGKRELLVCVDADHPSLPSVRYTAAQRREETHLPQHMREEMQRRPEGLTEKLKALADKEGGGSRSPSLYVQHDYFKRRRLFLDEAIQHYSDPWHRKRFWERHIRSQRSLTDFVRRLHTLQREKDVPLALAYGSWGAVAGHPDAPCNKGIPPCLGRGLRQKLSKHFLVICTPEQYTSKTCSLCGSTCGPCEEVDAEHRLKLLSRATTESETRRAMRFSVRGLRHCHNEHCAAHLNRDHNASVNIHRRCLSLLSDAPVHTPSNAVDAALETLHTWMIS